MFQNTTTTKGITISVDVSYEPHYSKPHQNHFVFSYRICIKNNSKAIVQLLRRHWRIFDSNGTQKEVNGEGVVGEQPVIAPTEQYEYSSWCVLKTPIGKMEGQYLMKRGSDNKTIGVNIPTFNLITPVTLN